MRKAYYRFQSEPMYGVNMKRDTGGIIEIPIASPELNLTRIMLMPGFFDHLERVPYLRRDRISNSFMGGKQARTHQYFTRHKFFLRLVARFDFVKCQFY